MFLDPLTWCSAGAFLASIICLKLYFSGPTCKISKNFKGKVVIVTGSNTGIGYQTALRLAEAEIGASVILACRDTSRAEAATTKIKQTVKDAKIEFIKLDLGNTKSIREFVDIFKSKYDRLDILINNAGLSMDERRVSSDGFELVFGTNHLGHFLLTYLLTDYLVKSAPSRVVNVSSIIPAVARIDWDDLMSEKNKYDWTKPYGLSKLSNVVFAHEFNRRYESKGVKAVSLHPGVAQSEFSRNLFKKFWMKVIMFIVWPLWLLVSKSPRKGAQTSIYCALEDYNKLQGGKYYADCKIRKLKNPIAFDEETGKKLWEKSVELLKIKENK